MYPYINIEPITQAAPTENCKLSEKSKIKMLATQVMMIARLQANPWIIFLISLMYFSHVFCSDRSLSVLISD